MSAAFNLEWALPPTLCCFLDKDLLLQNIINLLKLDNQKQNINYVFIKFIFNIFKFIY